MIGSWNKPPHTHALTRACMNIAFVVVSIADIVELKWVSELYARDKCPGSQAARSSTTYSVCVTPYIAIADTKHDVS